MYFRKVFDITMCQKAVKRKKYEGELRQNKDCIEIDDHPESIDSGCIIDSAIHSLTDISEPNIIDWDQVKCTLEDELHFISSLLRYVPIKQPIPIEHLLRNSKENLPADRTSDSESEEELTRKQRRQMRIEERSSKNYDELLKLYREKMVSLRRNKKNRSNKAKREEKKLQKKLSLLEKRKKWQKKVNKEITSCESPAVVAGSSSRPLCNEDGALVFSKFDFSSHISLTDAKKKKKKNKTILKNLLADAIKAKDKINELEEAGESEKACNLKMKKAWQSALKRAQGDKVKDDPFLLTKSLKRREERKKASKRKWEERIAKVEKAKTEKQDKRTQNILMKKQEKTQKKFKKQQKKGRLIPGF